MVQASLPAGASPLCLCTDSCEPSGLGQHVVTLAAVLAHHRPCTVAARDAAGGAQLLRQAASMGLPTLALDPDNLAGTAAKLRRLAPAALHVHAGIGWEGHGLVRAGRAAGVPVVLRTEHLPYLVTDADEVHEHARMAASVDRTICVSEAVRRSHVEAGLDPATLVTVRNGIADLAVAPGSRARVRVELGTPEGAPVVLMVGRFTPQKQHALILRALPAVLAQLPGLELWLAGSGPLGPTTAKMARQLGLGRAVRLLGQRSDVAGLMAAADILVCPSRFEGLPLVVLEAMALGLPVVAARIGGNDEAVLDGVTGMLVTPEDVGAWGRALLTVLGDRALAGELGHAGRRRYEQGFTDTRMARETLAVLESAMASAAASVAVREPLLVE